MTDQTKQDGHRFVAAEGQRYWMSVFDAVSSLWQSVTGSSDSLSDEDEEDIVTFLEYRLGHWTRSTKWSERYDEHVRGMIQACLRRHDEHVAETIRFLKESSSKEQVFERDLRACSTCKFFGQIHVHDQIKNWCFSADALTDPVKPACVAWIKGTDRDVLVDTKNTCSNCIHYGYRGPKPWCFKMDIQTSPPNPGCEFWKKTQDLEK